MQIQPSDRIIQSHGQTLHKRTTVAVLIKVCRAYPCIFWYLIFAVGEYLLQKLEHIMFLSHLLLDIHFVQSSSCINVTMWVLPCTAVSDWLAIISNVA